MVTDVQVLVLRYALVQGSFDLCLTVAPSILITAIDAYVDTFTLLTKPKPTVLSEF
jgi:hypothetical protein